MRDSTLSALQVRVLRALAGLQPPWTLTGGGALAGLYLGHRKTRDLDLFWHGLHVLPDLAELVAALERDGVHVDVLRRTPAFVELRASAGGEVTVIDLVADPVPTVEVPTRLEQAQRPPLPQRAARSRGSACAARRGSRPASRPRGRGAEGRRVLRRDPISVHPTPA